MPETAILNASVRWDPAIQDSIGPDYGWERLRNSTLAVTKAAGGAPEVMETSNAGHTTTFSWLNRSRKCAERVKQWAEQYEDGYFTIIDWDGGGRHYVGRFTQIPQITQAGNDRYNISGVPFEEVPTAPMLKYPDNWDAWAVKLNPVKDNGKWRAAVSGTWTVPQVNDDLGNTVSTLQLANDGTNAGDWACIEYRGYGFRLWLPQGPDKGQVQVYVDGVLYIGDTTADTAGLLDLNAQDAASEVALTVTNLPLDLHRVKVLVLGTTSSAAAGVVWDQLEVMR